MTMIIVDMVDLKMQRSAVHAYLTFCLSHNFQATVMNSVQIKRSSSFPPISRLSLRHLHDL